jgi:TrmH family RNA methyltransferase
MSKIESPQNDTFRKYLSLTTAKGLKQEGFFLLSGERLVREFLAAPGLTIIHELPAPGRQPLTQAPIIEFSRELFDQIDVLGTHANILVLEQPVLEVLDAGQMKDYAPQGIELAAPIGDPGNLGALLRSCDAFGVTRVILTQEAAHPFLPKAVKASAGSVLRLKICRGPPLADFPAGCIALDAGGVSIYDFTWPKAGLLVVGEEGAGLGEAAFTRRVGIPTEGVESLNAVVAASITLAHIKRKTAG